MQPAVARAAPDDRDIEQLLRSGAHERAFAELMERYESKVYRLCCALLRDRDEAEDAAQDSLVRIWRALASFDGRAALSTWIYAITRNRCLTLLERRRPLASLSEPSIASDCQALVAPAASHQAHSDRSAQLRALVDELPERMRRALLLFYFEERSIAEVALMLGCAEGTVKSHLSRARAQLHASLEHRGLADASQWLEEA